VKTHFDFDFGGLLTPPCAQRIEYSAI